jgi:hypothetical protein
MKMVIRARRFLIFLAIALALFFISLSSTNFYWPQMVQPSPVFFSGGYVAGPIQISLDVNLNLPSLSVDDSPRIEITRLQYNIVDQINAKSICFDSATIADTYMYTIFNKFLELRTENALENSLPLCYDVGSNEVGKSNRTIDLHDKVMPIDIFTARPDNFWYPYDNYAFDFAIQISYHLVNNDGSISNVTTIPVSLFIYPSDEVNWNTTITSKRYLVGSGEVNQIPLAFPYEHVNVSVVRPIYLKIAYPVLIGFIVIFIALLSTIENTEIFIEASVGLLFGLFGIRQLLQPPNSNVRTFLDVALIVIYLLFALALAEHIVNGFISAHNKNAKLINYLVGNKNSRIVHNKSCKYSLLIREDQLSSFINMDDAINKSFRPCKVCFPEHPQEKKAI